MSAYGCRKYQLSLEGLRETHDKIRRPGSFDETLAVIPYIRKAGIDVAVMFTVSKWNYKDLPELIDVVVENSVDIFAFARYCPLAEDRIRICVAPRKNIIG